MLKSGLLRPLQYAPNSSGQTSTSTRTADRSRIALSFPRSLARNHISYSRGSAHQALECMIIICRDDGDVFDAHDLSLMYRSLRRLGSNQVLPRSGSRQGFPAVLCRNYSFIDKLLAFGRNHCLSRPQRRFSGMLTIKGTYEVLRSIMRP